jgi:hypothetical protein
LSEKVRHFCIGVAETAGLLFVILPFLVSFAERHFYSGRQEQLPSKTFNLQEEPQVSFKITQPFTVSGNTSIRVPDEPTDIPEELMDKLLNLMSENNSHIRLLLSYSYLFSPHDPFEIYIHNALTLFKFHDSKKRDIYKLNKKKINQHIAGNLQKNKVMQPTELQKLQYSLLSYEVTNAGLYRNYYDRNTSGSALTIFSINMLLSAYFQKRDDIVFLNSTGENYLQKKDSTNKIACCSHLPFVIDSKDAVSEFVETILENELQAHSSSRPKAIFIPLQFEKPQTQAHLTLLVVEPSTTKLKEAKITMINTHGDSLSMYQSYEKAAMNAAHLVYNGQGTTVFRNQKRLWATASCSHNIIDIMRKMADVPSVQEAVKKGLQPMTAKGDQEARLEHGEKIKTFLEEKLKEESNDPSFVLKL